MKLALKGTNHPRISFFDLVWLSSINRIVSEYDMDLAVIQEYLDDLGSNRIEGGLSLSLVTWGHGDKR